MRELALQKEKEVGKSIGVRRRNWVKHRRPQKEFGSASTSTNSDRKMASERAMLGGRGEDLRCGSRPADSQRLPLSRQRRKCVRSSVFPKLSVGYGMC